MLSKIRILQVGDVHLPTAALAQRNVDQKDSAFSVELRNVISAIPTKVVFKQIYKLLDESGIDALIFMGDFTDRGALDHYERSSAFLANSLQIGGNRNHAAVKIGIVPGNHDINRDLAKQPGLATKFAPLNDHLRKNGLPMLPVERTISMAVRKGNSVADINLMNSCWGCGAAEYIPSEFREGIGKAIETAIAAGGASALQAYYDRQFDTPAFSNESIGEIVQHAATAEPQALLIIAAHHNLLPQRLTRLAPYTELVNSGAFRASLLETRRPILYLHGHIHEDPIEILSTPSSQCLITISAPAATDGFNMIEINYTRKGLPLSCRIYPWRFNASGVLHRGSPCTIPLLGHRRRSHDPSLGRIYSHLLSVGESYWSDLVNHNPAFFSIDLEESLREAIELLLADESIAVENYEFDASHWIVRAKI
ncbi:metallophosphoesterase [Mesorhizobium sp. M0189]|uniref:metallophosphoesterase family protein n=1 Tax=Mesorhizobium sp. M0189 TaxID=2956909 RepID=UPI0033363299